MYKSITKDVNSKKNMLYRISKRTMDLCGSIIGIILFSPLFIIVPILIKIESPGPVIFKQRRYGKNSEIFHIYKFRSMRLDAPNVATNDLKDSDVFITKIGKIIRKTSIDELPQLFNILKGDMSIVGPRPVIEAEYELVKLRKVYNVDSILPGITGWAQINGRDNISVEDKAKFDKEYVDTQSISLDIKIIFMTIYKVLKASDIRE